MHPQNHPVPGGFPGNPRGQQVLPTVALQHQNPKPGKAPADAEQRKDPGTRLSGDASMQYCRVGDRLGPLTDFPSADELPDGRIPMEIQRLQEKLHARRIHLATLSPNIDARELYRFMTGPFLELPLRELDSPAISCFVYDDFHPDPYFENEWTALECCIRPLLRQAPLLSLLPDGGLIYLNGEGPMPAEQCRDRISRFHHRYEAIVSLRCEALKTAIRDEGCEVQGRHTTGLCGMETCDIVQGHWRIDLKRNATGCWRVTGISIEGIVL